MRMGVRYILVLTWIGLGRRDLRIVVDMIKALLHVQAAGAALRSIDGEEFSRPAAGTQSIN